MRENTVQNKSKILAVDDNPTNNEIIQEMLSEDYDLQIATTGEEALKVAADFRPDLVLLDIMMPGIDGYEVCRRLRASSNLKYTKIILVSAKPMTSERLEGYEAGADDYIAKPFRPKEVIARVKALLRRHHRDEDETIQIKDVTINFSTHQVTIGNTLLNLTPKEFSLLKVLIHAKGRVLSRDQLLDQVWGFDYYGGPRTVDVHIRRLRKKLDRSADIVETIKGFGYRIQLDE